MSKRTVQRSLYQEGYNRRVVKKKVIGELKVSGTELYFQTKVRWSLETIIRFIFGGKRMSPEIVLVHQPRENYKEENHINCLEGPAQSPDLNVIENVWLKLKIRLQQRVEVLNTSDELSAAIKDIWENLSVDYIQGLYH